MSSVNKIAHNQLTSTNLHQRFFVGSSDKLLLVKVILECCICHLPVNVNVHLASVSALSHEGYKEGRFI